MHDATNTFLSLGERFTDRKAALLRAAVYLFCSLFSALVVSGILKRFARTTFTDLSAGTLPLQILAKLGLVFAFVILPGALCYALFREPALKFGLAVEGYLRAMGLGTLLGAAAFLATFLSIACLSRTSLVVNPQPAAVVLRQTIACGVLWTLGAVLEELTFRGYLLTHLSVTISFWPATLLLSTAFALIHLPQAGQPITGALSAGLVSLLLCWSVRIFGSVYFAISFHATWNFFESSVFGTNNSGARSPASITSWSFEGPTWITGGGVGPEGSVLTILVLMAVLFILVLYEARRGAGI